MQKLIKYFFIIMLLPVSAAFAVTCPAPSEFASGQVPSGWKLVESGSVHVKGATKLVGFQLYTAIASKMDTYTIQCTYYQGNYVFTIEGIRPYKLNSLEGWSEASSEATCLVNSGSECSWEWGP